MDSGDNNRSQPNKLPALSNTSIQILSNQVHLIDDILRERDPEYWFKKGFIEKKSGNWKAAHYFFSKALLVDSQHTKSYLLRGYVNYKLAEWDTCCADVICFFTKKYIYNSTNYVHELLKSDEWIEFFRALPYAHDYDYNHDIGLQIPKKKNFFFAYGILYYYAFGNDWNFASEVFSLIFYEEHIKWAHLIRSQTVLRHPLRYKNGVEVESCIVSKDEILSAINIDTEFCAGYFELYQYYDSTQNFNEAGRQLLTICELTKYNDMIFTMYCLDYFSHRLLYCILSDSDFSMVQYWLQKSNTLVSVIEKTDLKHSPKFVFIMNDLKEAGLKFRNLVQ